MKIQLSESIDINSCLAIIRKLNPLKGEYTIAHNPELPIILNKIFGYKPCYINILSGNGLTGFVQGCMIGGKFVSTPHFSYGGVVGLESMPLDYCELLKKYEIRSLKIESRFYDALKVTAYLHLEKDCNLYFKSLKYNVRRQIRIAQENGVYIKRGKLELLDDFFIVYCKNMNYLGFPPQPKYFFRVFLENWTLGDVDIFVAYKNDAPIGCSFLLAFEGIVENCWASTLREYNGIFTPYLMYWELIKYSIEKGNKIFSFGRSSNDSGTLAFKKHWKPDIITVYYNYSSSRSGGIKNSNKLKLIYKKVVPVKLGRMIGCLFTKYLY